MAPLPVCCLLSAVCGLFPDCGYAVTDQPLQASLPGLPHHPQRPGLGTTSPGAGGCCTPGLPHVLLSLSRLSSPSEIFLNRELEMAYWLLFKVI